MMRKASLIKIQMIEDCAESRISLFSEASGNRRRLLLMVFFIYVCIKIIFFTFHFLNFPDPASFKAAYCLLPNRLTSCASLGIRHSPIWANLRLFFSATHCHFDAQFGFIGLDSLASTQFHQSDNPTDSLFDFDLNLQFCVSLFYPISSSRH
ncbi:unnamed protein product [Protopolystoma xenopodis]|uniref:Uncharacterized protein n=1 Tax=Protopolystoma xenopodis TaxID=117903 RepID=A0A448XRC3_9PLAT|nr:unnamed protein product [Protopolystoma xenopodis]